MIVTPVLTPRTIDSLTRFQRHLAEYMTALASTTSHIAGVVVRAQQGVEYALATPARRDVIVSGWEARYATCVALDATVDPADLAVAVMQRRDTATAWMPAEARARVAAAVIRATVEHRPEEAEVSGVLAWHRLIGSTRVEVHRG